MKTKKHAKSTKKLSAAVKASWSNRKVRAARSARHNVRVGGAEYRSVAQAFDALDLDLAPHQKVRKELVAHGRVLHEGKRFTLVAH
jgi:hypothetical protein